MKNDKILKDIKRITDTIAQNQFPEIQELYQELYATYKSELTDLEGSLLPLHDLSSRFMNFNRDPHDQLPRTEYPANYIKNLKVIRGRLELLLDNDKESGENKSLNITINNDNKSSATNSVTMNINITFEDVKNQINSMEDVLGYDEVQLINSKIDELQKIVESSTKKSEKWKSIKEIGKWIFDKSVDVGIALLPLLLKINQ